MPSNTPSQTPLGKSPPTSDVKLARNWSASRVLQCLDLAQKHELAWFLQERYRERFFDAMDHLKTAPDASHGYGFAIVALCCLMIETIQCYRDGLPSSHEKELKALETSPHNSAAPDVYKLKSPFTCGSQRAFEEFFRSDLACRCLPGVDGKSFYQNIRCGLLHQAQTKSGWRIRQVGRYWDPAPPGSINRDELSLRLRTVFDEYILELGGADWDSEAWVNARTKIWWLAKLS